jgi:hypothetical protein
VRYKFSSATLRFSSPHFVGPGNVITARGARQSYAALLRGTESSMITALTQRFAPDRPPTTAVDAFAAFLQSHRPTAAETASSRLLNLMSGRRLAGDLARDGVLLDPRASESRFGTGSKFSHQQVQVQSVSQEDHRRDASVWEKPLEEEPLEDANYIFDIIGFGNAIRKGVKEVVIEGGSYVVGEVLDWVADNLEWDTESTYVYDAAADARARDDYSADPLDAAVGSGTTSGGVPMDNPDASVGGDDDELEPAHSDAVEAEGQIVEVRRLIGGGVIDPTPEAEAIQLNLVSLTFRGGYTDPPRDGVDPAKESILDMLRSGSGFTDPSPLLFNITAGSIAFRVC